MQSPLATLGTQQGYMEKKRMIKVTNCDGLFGALSSHGEIYTWHHEPDGPKEKGSVSAKRIWDLRKQTSTVEVCPKVTAVSDCS